MLLEWDEREEIPDPDDTKPDDWEQPEHIADPDAEKPDDWDDDMDGDWEAPMIDNPDYKGTALCLFSLFILFAFLFFSWRIFKRILFVFTLFFKANGLRRR